MLKILLTIALGLGIAGHGAFYSHIALNIHNRVLPLVLTGILGWACWQWAVKASFPCKRESKNGPSIKTFGGDNIVGLTILVILGIFLWLEAKHYPIGGWDAWSCWNLKAKFIFLGGERWKDMLDPLLWRSNTQYPLLLPSINVWFWDILGGAPQWVPMLNSIAFTLLSAGILLFSLKRASKQWLVPCLMTLAVFALPFNVTLGISQYSDVLVGLYLLCSFVCLLSEELVLCGLFLGLLSFTKTEGMLAAGILGALVVLKHKKNSLPFIAAFAIAALPTVIFQLCFAPKNEAFINGLFSTVKPSTWDRLETIASYTVTELASLKWNGLWLVLIGGVAACGKKAWSPHGRMMGLCLAAYLLMVLGYYYVNTFFEIGWWMQNTLNRVLFAMLPSAMLWLGLSLSKK